MNKQEFKQLVGEVLKENGFTYSNKYYQLENNELKVFIDFQKSNFSNSFYINYCFLVKALHEGETKISLKNSDFRSRFAYYTSEKTLGDFDLENLDDDAARLSIQKGIDEDILPAFKESAIKYLNERPIMKMMTSLEAKKYFKFIE